MTNNSNNILMVYKLTSGEEIIGFPMKSESITNDQFTIINPLKVIKSYNESIKADMLSLIRYNNFSKHNYITLSYNNIGSYYEPCDEYVEWYLASLRYITEVRDIENKNHLSITTKMIHSAVDSFLSMKEREKEANNKPEKKYNISSFMDGGNSIN